MNELQKWIKANYTQQALADKLGVCKQAVNTWYLGRNGMTVEHAIKLSKLSKGALSIETIYKCTIKK